MAQTKANDLTTTRVFRMKAGTEVPKKLDGAEIRFRVAAPLTEADQDNLQEATFLRMVELAGGNVTQEACQAILDTFNSAAALATQKAIKDAAGPDSTVDQLQKVSDGFTIEPNKRGRGGKKAATKAKAEKMDSVQAKAEEQAAKLEALKESDPAAYEAKMEMLRELGLA